MSAPPTPSCCCCAPGSSICPRAGSPLCCETSPAYWPSVLEARERARSRASSLQVEAAILALSPIVLLLLVGVASPAYLDAYRTPAGTLVGVLGGAMIFGCYVMMRRLGRVPEPRRTAGQR